MIHKQKVKLNLNETFLSDFKRSLFKPASAAAKEDDENAISVTLKTAAVLNSSFLS